MRIASFNVENLFDRARVLNQDQWTRDDDETRWAAGRPVLDAFAALNALLRQTAYGAADKTEIVRLLKQLGLERSDTSPFVILRQNRGRLVRRPRAGGIEVVANGRADWIGWVELRTEAVDETATQNTGRVFRDVNADIVAVVEAENRISLNRFNEQVLKGVGGAPYDHVMLIDGNDDRGIDVGLMLRAGYDIAGMRSHVDDRDDAGRIFSRDCPEYDVRLPSGGTLTILVNHFKSKGFGSTASSNARRRAQAARVREIYEALAAGGRELIAVVGDLNDTPDSAPLAPLLAESSPLRDIGTHPRFQDDGRAPSPTAPRAASSTISCSRPRCSIACRAAGSTARACGAERTARSGPCCPS